MEDNESQEFLEAQQSQKINETKINAELLKRLRDFFDHDLENQIEANRQSKMPMFGQSDNLTSSEKEIVVNIKSYIYEKNEKGETTAPSDIFENNFYIPISSNQDSEEALKLFTTKLNECLVNSAKEVAENE